MKKLKELLFKLLGIRIIKPSFKVGDTIRPVCAISQAYWFKIIGITKTDYIVLGYIKSTKMKIEIKNQNYYEKVQ